MVMAFPMSDVEIADRVVFDAARGEITSSEELSVSLKKASDQMSTDTGPIGVLELIERRHLEYNEYGPLIIGSIAPEVAEELGLVESA